ncbi:MAG TPA: patatin-like phospholipase family protein [Gemmatimonadaceae bacterium]|nr:patatin-like phospholipase family protein [Gemmatimonadaceae bacterium]
MRVDFPSLPACSLALVVAACAQYPHTAPTPVSAPAGALGRDGYRFENFPAAGRNTDSIFVILTFSGGGTRAAAFAYGALLELHRTHIDTGSRVRSLLEEVDVISTISGGSFAGAFYTLYGIDSLRSFEQKFLTWNAERTLKRELLTPALIRLISPNYSRSDLAAETWDSRLFHGATFSAILAHRRRPYLIVNATDMSLGAPFSFTQEQFDPMCNDLADFPIARAVASSSAFPGLLTPITIENHAGRCAFRPPGWAVSDILSANINADAYRAARDYFTYADSSRRPYVHLMDGGPSDNLGIRPVLRGLSSIARDFSLLRLQANGRLRRVVVIVVNARTAGSTAIDRSPNPPGILGVLKTAAGVPFDNYSNESLVRLEMLSQERRAARINAECYNRLLARTDPRAPVPTIATLAPINIVHITFDALKDPTARAYFLGLPTSFSLPASTVTRLRDVAGQLLREHETFQEVVNDLRHLGKPAPLRCLGQ